MPDRSREMLDQLNAVRDDPSSPQAIEVLRKALKSSPNRVAARAARVAQSAGLYALAEDLVAAFERFMTDPLKSDRGCDAKLAIALALAELEPQATGVFLAAARHSQPEPSFGGPVDTAVELRCAGVMALALARHPQAEVVAAELLADEVPGARTGAVRALRAASSAAARALLRFKALIADSELAVMDECLQALIELGDDAVPFVARFLREDSAPLAAVAAFALGGSHDRAALPFLETAWQERLEPEVRRAIIDAAAMLRTPEGVDFVIERIGAGEQLALHALEALAPYAPDGEVRSRVEAAVRERHSANVSAAFRQLFGAAQQRGG